MAVDLDNIVIKRKIGAGAAELEAVAREVVDDGNAIEDAEIADLRLLIEAVQALAATQGKLAPAWKRGMPGRSQQELSVVTELRIDGGRVLRCECGERNNALPLEILITLVVKKTAFAADAHFGGASFAAIAWFNGASFAGTGVFGGASFAGLALFLEVSFAGLAIFHSASFAAEAWFDKATFATLAWFDGASFTTPARFSGASFAAQAWFRGVSFAGGAGFDGASFEGEALGDLRTCTVRLAKAAMRERTRDFTCRVMPRWWTYPFRWAWMTLRRFWLDKMGWSLVRSLGQLQILARVSLVALFVVPTLAAAYAPLLDALAKHKNAEGALQPDTPAWMRLAVHVLGTEPHLGYSLAFAFFAAVGVTLGLLLYQVFAPDIVKKHDEEGHVRDVEARYPEGQPQRGDGLRRALERIEDQAKKRPNRHPSFVKHHGDLIWLPPRDHIEWFDDNTLPTVPVLQVRAEAAAKKAGVNEDQVEEIKAKVLDPKQREGYVAGAERARICIEEGARAEYWLKSREKLGLAWASLGFYVAGILCLLFILGMQMRNVGLAAFWPPDPAAAEHARQRPGTPPDAAAIPAPSTGAGASGAHD